MASKRYKDFRFYAFVALNFIATTLEIYIHQDGLMEIIEPLLEEQPGVSKSAIMYEIKSNHNMTNKVIDYLVEEELVNILFSDGEYSITITKKGMAYLREYSRFYSHLFREEISSLYRFRSLPSWAD